MTVTDWSTITTTGTSVDSASAVVEDAGGSTTTYNSPSTIAVGGDPTSTTVVGDQRTRTWAINNLTSVLIAPGSVPLTATDQLGGGQTVPGEYFSLSNFPHFQYSIDNGLGGGFEGQLYLLLPDTTPIGPLVEPSVTYLPSQSSGVTAQGRYGVTWSGQAFGPASPYVLTFTDPAGTKSTVNQSLADRVLGSTASTDPDIASFIGQPVEQLLPVRLPFVIQNATDLANPTDVTVVIIVANKQTQLLLGLGQDTMIVDVPDTEWLPGDGMLIVEGTSPDFNVTFASMILGCDPVVWVRVGCNPVALSSVGATGYIPNGANMLLGIAYFQTITSATEYTFDVASAVTGARTIAADDLASLQASLDSVKVVPNPYVMFSEYTNRNISGTDRLLFTHVPPRGKIRIYTVSGQFVQLLRWAEGDLNDQGDLWFNLRTREGNEMAGGLYLFVLVATDANSNELGRAKGKFVIIR